MSPINEKQKNIDNIKCITQPRTNKKISIKTKIIILKKLADGMKSSEVAKSLDMSVHTINTIKKNKKKILEFAENISVNVGERSARARDPVIASVESALLEWITNQINEGAPLSASLIRCKAQSLFERLTEEKGFYKRFSASPGWFQKFKERHHLRNMRFFDGASLVNSAFSTDSQQVNKEIVDETELSWKKIPNTIGLSEDERSSSEFQPHNDRLSLLLATEPTTNLNRKKVWPECIRNKEIKKENIENTCKNESIELSKQLGIPVEDIEEILKNQNQELNNEGLLQIGHGSLIDNDHGTSNLDENNSTMQKKLVKLLTNAEALKQSISEVESSENMRDILCTTIDSLTNTYKVKLKDTDL